MLITEVGYTLPPASSGLALKKPSRRSVGDHVSNTLRDIENKVILPGQRPSDVTLSPFEMQRMGNYREMGFIWELIVEALTTGKIQDSAPPFLHALVEHFFAARMIARRKVKQQGEIFVDDLFGTPDAMDLKNWVLEEYKATWKASWRVLNIEREFWYWFHQIMAYAYMISAVKKRWVLQGRLFVFFVNGDYRESGPQIRQFNMEFSIQELVENWDMIKRHHRRMRAKAKS